MGFFGKLFEKKTCVCCGAAIGMLSGHKLADGHLCNACAGTLSPFFDEWGDSTAAQIEAQRAYREENARAVIGSLEALCAAELIGECGCVLLDRDNRRFAAFAKAPDDLAAALQSTPPDLISFDQVRDIELRQERVTKEEMRTEGDKKVSYDPPRFVHTFNFYVTIHTSHPYAKHIRLRLNNLPVRVRMTGDFKTLPRDPRLPPQQILPGTRLGGFDEVRMAFEGRLKDRFGAVSFDERRTAEDLENCTRFAQMSERIDSLLRQR